MPPNSPKIPDAEIELIRKWIEGGALENSGQQGASVKAKPKFEFKLDPAALGKPAGPPPMPENLSTEPFVAAGQAERRSSRWPPARGPRWSPSAATSRCCSTNDRQLTWSACCRSPRARSTSSSSAATATCCWPAAAAAGSRAWPSSGT